jgi:ABC-type histidine transport system ATPase subunit
MRTPSKDKMKPILINPFSFKLIELKRSGKATSGRCTNVAMMENNREGPIMIAPAKAKFDTAAKGEKPIAITKLKRRLR